MLIKSNGLLYDGLFLVTLGNTCRYLLKNDSGKINLFNTSLPFHTKLLCTRIEQLGMGMADVNVIFLSNLSPMSVGAVPEIKSMFPQCEILISASMAASLKNPESLPNLVDEEVNIGKHLGLSFDDSYKISRLDAYGRVFDNAKVLGDSDVFHSDEFFSIRLISTPGYSSASTAFLVLPHEFLIVDQTFGFFRGREMAAPGAIFNIEAAAASVQKCKQLNLSGLGFPFMGAVTGALINKHLDQLQQNTQDIFTESANAAKDGVTIQTIQESIRESFYTSDSKDPVLQWEMSRVCSAMQEKVLSK